MSITEGPPHHARHLGDGAYVHVGSYVGEVVITANHHDPAIATDVVVLDSYAIEALRQWLAERENQESP